MPRKKKTYKVYIPEGFDPLDHLPPDLHKYADSARYFIHTIYRRRINHKQGREGFVNLKAAYLRKVLVNQDKDYLPLKDALLKDVLECDWDWQYRKPGNYRKPKSFGFRLREPFQSATHREYNLTDQRLIGKLYRRRKKRLTEDLALPVHAHLHRYLQGISFDYDAAVAWINSEQCQPRNRQGEQVDVVQYRDTIIQQAKEMKELPLRFTVDDNGRVHTPLTSLKTQLRQFLTYQGEVLVNIDIKNSQPLFFSILVLSFLSNAEHLGEVHSFCLESWRERLYHDFPGEVLHHINRYLKQHPSPTYLPIRCLIGTSIPRDVEKYITLCESGNLYPYLMKKAGVPAERQKEYKRKVFGRIFFKKNGHQYRESRLFRRLFPTVDKVIQRIKHKDFRHLPRLLQKVESDLMIHRVCYRMMLEHPQVPVFTIHDSIMVPSGDAALVQRIVVQEFNALGLSPGLRVEGS